ncbi:response regulator transcription factor [Enterococcus sp. JM9B]|uniref:response regulator transcription factor n=1 Tax=Enterococcus sp. JM9B TaxID=1857216 RepID=UPI001375133F|nr:response regulator [Enterococcus sp. JM9B]KAF1301862.1 hypothetical protein BAU16_08230 [Enterococcus sp. JM9B]
MTTLLIIDDEKALREGLAGYIRTIPSPFQQVLTAADSQEALTLFEKQSVAVAFVDINLPDMNGLDLIHLLNQRYPDTIIIIISGFDDFDFARRAITLNVYDYLLKPIPKTDLKKILTQLTQLLKKQPVTVSKLTLPQEAKMIIDTHYSEKNLALNTVAARLFVSDTYLSRQMKKELGYSFSEYLIQLRIQKAKELLADHQLLYSISEIATKVGYEDPHYFSRIFRKKVGVSPIEFQRENKKLDN